MLQFVSAGSTAWEGLKKQAQAWANKVVEVYNTPVPQSLAADKAKLLSFAKTIKTTIEKIYGGMTGLNDIGLGAAFPLVPIAVIAGAAAAITKWTYDYNAFKAKLSEYQKMVASGVPPGDAAKTVELIDKKNSSTNAMFSAMKILPLAVVGLIGYNILRNRG